MVYHQLHVFNSLHGSCWDDDCNIGHLSQIASGVSTVVSSDGNGGASGAGASAQAILGGENAVGNGGAVYRIKRIEYGTSIRS